MGVTWNRKWAPSGKPTVFGVPLLDTVVANEESRGVTDPR